MNTSSSSNNALRQSQYSNAANLTARIRIHQQFSTAVETWDEFLLSNLRLLPGQTILELGCGNASQTRHNRSTYPASVRYLLSDFSFGMMQEAISELNADPRFSFSVQDAQALALPANSFDFISANHMLYHVPDIKLALREIHRLLKPGGRLMAATNGSGHMQDLDQLVQSFYPGSKGLHLFHSRFNLENGFDMVESVFGNCTLKTYLSDLWVTQAQPLTDYVLSLDSFLSNSIGQNPQELTLYFQKLIDLEGGIKIRKSTGLLLATK